MSLLDKLPQSDPSERRTGSLLDRLPGARPKPNLATRIMEALQSFGRPATKFDIQTKIGGNAESIKVTLGRMARKGLVVRAGTQENPAFTRPLTLWALADQASGIFGRMTMSEIDLLG